MRNKGILLLALAVIWCSSAIAQDHFTERDTIDVQSYHIKLDVGHLRPHYIQGSCKVGLKMLQPSHVVSLGLMDARVDSVQVNDSMLYQG